MHTNVTIRTNFIAAQKLFYRPMEFKILHVPEFHYGSLLSQFGVCGVSVWGLGCLSLGSLLSQLQVA